MKEKYNQIIEEAYENYSKWVNSENRKGNDDANALRKKGILVKQYYVSKLSQEEFINKIKTDSDFSERWGLKIEERELSHDERFELYKKVCGRELQPHITGINFKQFHFDEFNVPTKLITLTYNNEKFQTYE